MRALADDAHSLCEPVLDGCNDAELMADATRVCAASSVLTGNPAEAIARLTPLYQAQTHRVGTELASAQLAAGEQEEAAATLADDAATLELLERAADEVCALGSGRIPENPLGDRTASNMLPAITDDEALAHMRESASYAHYPEAARHMILDARLWGALAQSPEYAALAKRLDAE